MAAFRQVAKLTFIVQGVHLLASIVLFALLFNVASDSYIPLFVSIIISLTVYPYLAIELSRYFTRKKVNNKFIHLVPLLSIMAVSWLIWLVSYLYVDDTGFLRNFHWIIYYAYNWLFIPVGLLFLEEGELRSLTSLLLPLFPTVIMLAGYVGHRLFGDH